MKKILFFILLPMVNLAQIQIGADINGETAGDVSGRSVSLSSNGSILAIGSYLNDGSEVNAGSVRVYQNTAGSWTQIGADIDGEAPNDLSGSSVSLSSNGSTLAIGAYQNDGNGANAGSVRVYQNTAGTWTQIGADINGEAAGDNSGFSVSLSSDGFIVAVGAYLNDGSGADAGSVRVYQNTAGAWTQIGADIDGEAANDLSGSSVSLSSNGSTLAIGAYQNDGNGINTGSVRVYQNVLGNWIKIGDDIDGDINNHQSGISVSLSSDSSTVAIGNIGNILGTSAGSVRVYQNISGSWIKIGGDINGEAAADLSGISVSLSSNGSILAIGAYQNDGNGSNSGSVRVYKNISGTWTKIGDDIDGEAVGDFSGSSVSLSSNGSILAIGAHGNDGNGVDAGSVRVYNLSTILSSDSFVLSNFKITPNPSSDQVTITLQENLKLEKVNIYNTLGQLIKIEKNNTINVSNFAKGSYFFEVVTNKGKATKTILVQ